MKRSSSTVGVLAALPCVVSAAGVEGTHPIEKVIGLLKDLSSKVEEEAKAEAISYTKYEYWCKTSEKTLSAAIAAEQEMISALESKIEGKQKEAVSLEEQIAELEAEIAKHQAAQKKADDIRKAGAELYAKTSADLEATITAIIGAIKALETAKGEVAALQQ